MEVVCDHPQPAQDALPLYRQVPLGHRLASEARLHAGAVGLLGDAPLLVEPGRGRLQPAGLLPQLHKASVFHDDALLSPPVYYSGGAGGIVRDIKITHILVKYLDCFPKPPVLE